MVETFRDIFHNTNCPYHPKQFLFATGSPGFPDTLWISKKAGYHVHYIGNENGSFIAPAMLWVSFVHLAVDYTLLNNITYNDKAVRYRTLMF